MMKERFGKDCLIAIATTDGERMHNRMVDAYYEDGVFYVTTGAMSGKMQQIALHPDVAVCAIDWFSGHGIARNRGWVLDPSNAEIRLKLRDAFAAWYDYANDEQNPDCCILEIQMTDGMLIKDHHTLRYRIDFTTKTATVSENGGEYK